MKLDEAIEIKETYLKGDEAVDHYKHLGADRLALEALKRVKWHKDQHQQGYYELLPGETEE